MMRTYPPAIWDYFINDEKVEISKSFKVLFGLPEQFQPHNFDELFRHGFTNSNRDIIKFHIRNFAKTEFEFGKSSDIEFRISDVDGNIRFFYMVCFFKTENIISSILRDITLEKLQEQKLIYANENLEYVNQKLKGIVENTKNGIIVYKPILNGSDFEISCFNPAASQLEKINSEDAIGRKMSEIFPQSKYYGLLITVKRVYETGKPENLPVKVFSEGKLTGWRENYIIKIPTGEIVTIYNDYSNIRLSERKLKMYKKAVDQSANSIVITDTFGNIDYVNERFTSLTGYKAEEVIGKNPRILKSGKIKRQVYKQMWESLSQGKTWTGEFENIAKNGKFFWVNASISPIFDDDKNIISYLSIQEDITAKKEAIDKLVINENKMRHIFNAMDDAVFDIDKNGVYTFIAPTKTSLLYMEPDELLGKSLFDVFPKDKAEEYFGWIGEAHRVGKTIVKEYELEIKNSMISFEARITPKDENSVTIITRNISQRKQALQKLFKSESRFRILFEKSVDPVLILKNGRFIECNQAAVDILGYNSKDQLIFKHPNDISPILQEDGNLSESKAELMIDLAMSNGFHRFEWHHIKSDGTIFPVEVLLTSLEDFDGQTIIHVVWRDITESKQREREIIKAKEQAIKADHFKSAFLANMSHEIRTPMNGIIGFTELLAEPDVSDEEKRQFIKIIRKSGLNMLNIINDILDISKIEAGEVELNPNEHNVTDTLVYLYDFFKPEFKKKEIEWIAEFSPKEKHIIRLDQFKLNEILTNLIKNAVKYTYQGSVKLGILDRTDKLIFYVKDTGIGIPHDKQELVFNRFAQAGNDITHMVYGTGLGLAISKAYVEMHGGRIWLESVPGKGSTFYFSIPKELRPQVLMKSQTSQKL